MNELLPPLALIAVALVPAAGLCLAAAVGADAKARGASHLGWAFGVFAFPVLFLPAYLYVRNRRLPDRVAPPDRRERLVGAAGTGGFAGVFGAAMFSPPDPVTFSLWALAAVPVCVVVAYILWFRSDSRDHESEQ